MFKYEVGDICMIKNAPEAYDELYNWFREGSVVKI